MCGVVEGVLSGGGRVAWWRLWEVVEGMWWKVCGVVEGVWSDGGYVEWWRVCGVGVVEGMLSGGGCVEWWRVCGWCKACGVVDRW